MTAERRVAAELPALSSRLPLAAAATEEFPPLECLPAHVAIIMDGNGRWAEYRGLSRKKGHEAGLSRLHDLLQVCRHYDIRVLTLFVFSRENWQRPPWEVRYLLNMFRERLERELDTLLEARVRVRVIGDRKQLGASLCALIEEAEQRSLPGARYTLNVALDYSGQWDVTQAVRAISQQVARGALPLESIDQECVDRHICLGDLPAPDLCIRTGGEQRISNFLLWQLAYTELYFTSLCWPDFGVAEFVAALQDYAGRQRRFGARVATEKSA